METLKQPNVLYGLHAVREALRSRARPFRKLLILRTDRQFTEIVRQAQIMGVPVHIEQKSALDRLVPNGLHQGVIALVAPKAYVTTDNIMENLRVRGEPPLLVILDGVEDPQNLGAILRSAEGAGVHGVFIPSRRAAGLTGSVAKTSAGAVEHLPVSCVQNVSRLIEHLQAQGLWIYGLDPWAGRAYTTVDFRGPIGLVLGGEGRGIRPSVLEKCDERINIPMKGQVASLNVSAAAAVVLFETVRQRGIAQAVNEPESFRPESRL